MSQKRHDRSNLILDNHIDKSNFELFYSKNILITGDEYLKTKNGILIAKTIVNLISRFTNNLTISFPKQFEILQDELISISQKIGTNTTSKISQKYDIVISIGNTPNYGLFTIRLYSDGWVSHLSCNKPLLIPDSQLTNPIGAMGSACFGATECFKRLLEITGSKDKKIAVHPDHFVFSFLDYSLTETNSDFPSNITLNENILLVGAGAVGNSIVFGLSQIPNIKGNVSVIDHDCFDETNLNRCPIVFMENLGQNKAKITEKYSTKNLKFNAFPTTFSEFQKQHPTIYPVILSTVDNDKVRYEIQSKSPKLIFHGSTGGVLVSVSTIKFLENACLCCIFDSKKELNHETMISNHTGIPIEIVSHALDNDEKFSDQHLEFLVKKLGSKANQFKIHIGKPFKKVYAKEICGEMEIQTDQGEQHASVSFVSFFAGLGVLSELIKYNSVQKNISLTFGKDFFRINMFKPDHIGPPHRYQKNPNCLLNCSSKSAQKIFAKLWEIQN